MRTRKNEDKKTMSRAARMAVFFLCFAAMYAVSARAGQEYPAENVLEIDAFEKKHNKMMDEALDAYNSEDAKEFYKNFDESTHARTERTFKYIWVEGTKARFGKIISRKIEYEKSNTNGPYPLLAYEAKFEKDDSVEIKFSFIRGNGEYKIFSLRMDDVRESEK